MMQAGVQRKRIHSGVQQKVAGGRNQAEGEVQTKQNRICQQKQLPLTQAYQLQYHQAM
ncbi:MAG: hypothetical protein GY696_32040 [Gammaproteobacteria bacterium]|nr:hypothetical protein [Gammaproteobacteria bacterium]